MSYFAMPPLDIIDHPADDQHADYSASGLLRTPRYIIIHATAGENSLDWLSDHPESYVSVHRLISKGGTIYKILPDERQCYGAGYASIGSTRNLNPYALQIELENLNNGRDPYPLIQIERCAAQCCEWWGMYGALPIFGHSDVDGRKSDPKGFGWPVFWWALFGLVGRSMQAERYE